MKIPDKIVWVTPDVKPSVNESKVLTVERIMSAERLMFLGFWDGANWRYSDFEQRLIEGNPTEPSRVVAWAEPPVIPRFEACEPVPAQHQVIQTVVWHTHGNPVAFENVNVTVEDMENGDRKQGRAYWNGWVWRYTSSDELVEFDSQFRVIAWAEDIILQPLEQHASRVTFGQAIEALKLGHKVTRVGWNGKGMYLWLLPAATVKAEWCREPHLKEVAEANLGEIECLGSIRMFTVNSSGRKAVLTGWLASQSDMLAEDWRILE